MTDVRYEHLRCAEGVNGWVAFMELRFIRSMTGSCARRLTSGVG